jgi:hypothetical protein
MVTMGTRGTVFPFGNIMGKCMVPFGNIMENV